MWIIQTLIGNLDRNLIDKTDTGIADPKKRTEEMNGEVKRLIAAGTALSKKLGVIRVNQ